MKGFWKVGLLIAVAMALFGTYRFVSAQDETSPFGRIPVKAPTFHKEIPANAPKFNKGIPDVESTEHVLEYTYLSVGTGHGAPVPATTLTPIDSPSTVVCPGSGTDTCTILANQFVQTAGSTGSNNFAICLYVDGNLIPNNCWYTNDTLSDGTYIQGATSNWKLACPSGATRSRRTSFRTMGVFMENITSSTSFTNLKLVTSRRGGAAVSLAWPEEGARGVGHDRSDSQHAGLLWYRQQFAAIALDASGY